MRVVFLSQYFPPEIGAPQSRLFETALGLSEMGWVVKVITALPNYPFGLIFDGYRNRLEFTERIKEIDVHRYWIYPSNSKRIVPRLVSMVSFGISSLISLIRVVKFRPNYLVVESPPFVLMLTGMILAWTSRAKLVLNVSDIWPSSAKDLGFISGGRLYEFLERIESFFYRRAFLCTGQSQEIIDHIVSRGARRVHLFRNGVETQRFLRAESKIIERQNKCLVYAGLLGIAQGIAGICRNVRFDKLDVEFHIYGTGPERNEIEDILKCNSISNIYLHDAVSRDDVPGILRGFDGALIPLACPIYGAVPSKIYEAMAAGLPIIFAGDGEGARIVRDSQVGWTVPAGGYRELEETILDFRRNDEKRKMYSVNGASRAADTFERSVQVRRLHDCLMSTLNCEPASRRARRWKGTTSPGISLL